MAQGKVEICGVNTAKLPILNEKEKEAHRLIQWLLPFLDFKTLWVSEKRYNEEEFWLSAYLLFSYIGLHEKADACLLEAKERLLSLHRPINPFFFALEGKLKELPSPTGLLFHQTSFDASLGAWIDRGAELSSAITLSGYGTSLGVFQKKGVEVRAAGPQFYPLTDAMGFGIKGLHVAHVIDSSRMRGWTRCFGQNDVWVDVSIEGPKLDLKFIGTVPEKKMVFSFYVKAKMAEISGSVFRSNSLQRYNGDDLVIQASVSNKVELIPLAGKECFWGADFLVAFEINPFEPTLSLQFS